MATVTARVLPNVGRQRLWAPAPLAPATLDNAVDEGGKRVRSETLIARWYTHKSAIWQASCAQFGTGFGGKF